jgi:predicted AlkP superfamily pyrophosphatase or phosphodiesterase
MRRTVSIFLWAFLGAGFLPAPAAIPGQQPDGHRVIEHVFLVTVDGLRPAVYLHPDAEQVRVPVLDQMRAQGSFSPAVESVFPTQTYPAHTAIATGTWPEANGIVSNLAWDPLERNQGGWRWYAQDIRTPTIWQLAVQRGLRVALVSWPVTVGAEAEAVVPEFWRAGTADDVKLLRALWYPRGLFTEIVRAFPDFLDGYHPPANDDRALTDIAVHLIATRRPHLLLLHIFQVDHWEHQKGVHSPEARRAIENADAQLGRLIRAAQQAGIWQHTVLVVASDHGMADVREAVRPGVLLARLGLVTPGRGNTLRAWKAVVVSNGGSAYLYVHPQAGPAVEARLRALFLRLAERPSSGIAAVYTRDQIRALHGDPNACLALEARPGYMFLPGYTGPYHDRPPVAATHGYDPQRASMKASLLLFGPPVGHTELARARLVDVAPTIARWLELPLDKSDGHPLPVPLR